MTGPPPASAPHRWCPVLLKVSLLLLTGTILFGYALDAWGTWDAYSSDDRAGPWRAAGSLVGITAAWFLLWFGAMFVYTGVSLWLVNRTIVGPGSADSRAVMARLAYVARYRDRLLMARHVLPWGAAVPALFWLVIPDWHLLMLTALPLGMSWWMTIRFTRLPAVLVLGTSDPRSLARFAAYVKHFQPLRVVCLLDTGAYGSGISARVLDQDCLRTNDIKDWQIVIGQLLVRIPILVIDGDVTTDGVVWEAQQIRDANLAYKTVFISSVAPEADLLQRVDPSGVWSGRACVLEEDEIVSFLSYVLRRPDLPTPERSAEQIAAYLRATSRPSRTSGQTN